MKNWLSIYCAIHVALFTVSSVAQQGLAEPSIDYATVTQQRLEQPADGEWLLYRRTYASWGYSPLSEINTGNVQSLKPLWTFSTGVNEAHQSPPLVNGRYMFVTTPENHVLALDAKTGDMLWRYRRELPEDLL